MYAAIAIAVSLIFFDVANNPVIVAAFGSSSCAVFAMPHRKISRGRNLLGGYLIGIFVGVLLHYCAAYPVESQVLEKAIYIFLGALAVGVSMFLMTMTSTEHSPAAGVSLGVVISPWTSKDLVMIMIGITAIVIVHKLLKKQLIDLLD